MGSAQTERRVPDAVRVRTWITWCVCSEDRVGIVEPVVVVRIGAITLACSPEYPLCTAVHADIASPHCFVRRSDGKKEEQHVRREPFMKTWYLAVLLVACGATETHVAAPCAEAPSAEAPSVAATQHVPPVVSSSPPPGPIVVPPRSLTELRQQAQTVREARRAELEAYEGLVCVDDGDSHLRSTRGCRDLTMV